MSGLVILRFGAGAAPLLDGAVVGPLFPHPEGDGPVRLRPDADLVLRPQRDAGSPQQLVPQAAVRDGEVVGEGPPLLAAEDLTEAAALLWGELPVAVARLARRPAEAPVEAREELVAEERVGGLDRGNLPQPEAPSRAGPAAS